MSSLHGEVSWKYRGRRVEGRCTGFNKSATMTRPVLVPASAQGFRTPTPGGAAGRLRTRCMHHRASNPNRRCGRAETGCVRRQRSWWCQQRRDHRRRHASNRSTAGAGSRPEAPPVIGVRHRRSLQAARRSLLAPDSAPGGSGPAPAPPVTNGADHQRVDPITGRSASKTKQMHHGTPGPWSNGRSCSTTAPSTPGAGVFAARHLKAAPTSAHRGPSGVT